MLLEVLLFRRFSGTPSSRWRQGINSSTSGKGALARGLAFHYTFLVILVRHLRFFYPPVPFCEASNGWTAFQVGLRHYSAIYFRRRGHYLIIRRVIIPQVRYMSACDYFPLFLILASRHRHAYALCHPGGPAESEAVFHGLITSTPVRTGSGVIFFIHLFLVTHLFAIFRSEAHACGRGLPEPNRNMPNDTRIVRHINPWTTR